MTDLELAAFAILLVGAVAVIAVCYLFRQAWRAVTSNAD